MRTKLIHEDRERVFVIVFETGDEAMSGLLAFAKEHRIEAAQFTAIGALSSVTFGFFDWERKDYVRLPDITEQIEVLSLTGNIALKDKDPMVHAHIVIGKANGTAHGGHLFEAVVRPTLEVVVTESPGHLRRNFDTETHLPLIKL